MADIELSVLNKIIPFSFLPASQLETLLDSFSLDWGKKDEIKFIQRHSKVNYLYIIARGSAELYFEQDRKKSLNDLLSEGDSFGGISMLVNRSVAVRSMVLLEDTTFFRLPENVFFSLCKEYDYFKEFFTNTFGRKMLNRSYADIITRQFTDQTKSSSFYHQPISAIFHPDFLASPGSITIQEAARIMTDDGAGYLLVMDDDFDIIGIVTDEDMRKRVVARNLEIHSPVSDIMTSPLLCLPETAQVFEAYIMMIERGISHLAVSNSAGQITGMLTDRQIITEHGQSPSFLIREIKETTSPDQLKNIHQRLPAILIDPIKNGAQPDNLTQLITTFSDAILKQLITFALAQAGPPPCDFAFLVMGSEGRREQTLKTDQDNAIVYRDFNNKEEASQAQKYFLHLAEMICTWLHQAGYNFCEGGNMAKNPQWCQPLAVWKNYFHKWIHAASPEDLLNSSIFFDFRCGGGEHSLALELRDFLTQSLQQWPGFFRNMVENALYFKPPLGFFRNIVVQSKGEHKDTFDIKYALMPVVDFARIYALKHNIRATNTLIRLEEIYSKELLIKEEYEDIVQSYMYMMNLRFIRQVNAITRENGKADNFINPKQLSRIDQTMLKEIFRRTEGLQQKMSLEFTGI